jgi:hypothetical protein
MQRRTLLCGGRLAFIAMMPGATVRRRIVIGDGENSQISRVDVGQQMEKQVMEVKGMWKVWIVKGGLLSRICQTFCNVRDW